MHLTIPETREKNNAKGSSYTTFVIHINGIRHCEVRFRQLHSLHNQLKKEFSSQIVPTFPPKKLLRLNGSQVEERRIALEKYLQMLVHDTRILNGITFNGFLLGAQMETSSMDKEELIEEAILEVYLMNDHKISILGTPSLQSDEMLERVCKQQGVPQEFYYHFGLFLTFRKDNGDFVIIRKLQNFESPYISLRNCSTSSNPVKIVLRKTTWDPEIDEELFAHQETLNLLYIQTVVEIEKGWIQANSETMKNLTRMQATGAKLEYMKTAWNLPYYGYIHFQPCFCDNPVTNTPSQIIIGNRELIMKIRTPKGEIKENYFQVVKMRCWKIMTLANNNPNDFNDCRQSENQIDTSINDINGTKNKLEFSFQYLVNDEDLQWITIVSSQATFMSLCLQSIVEELLRQKSSITLRRGGEKYNSVQYTYLRQDGSIQNFPICSRLSYDNVSVPKVDLSSISSRQYTVKNLSARFDVINFSDASKAAEDVFYENEAFIDTRKEEQEDN